MNSRPERLADSIRVVLRDSGEPMTPREVRDRLVLAGAPLPPHLQLLASVHSTLKHMAIGRRREVVAMSQGRYRWTAPTEQGAFKKITTNSCHHAPGKYALSERLPDFVTADERKRIESTSAGQS